MARYKFYVSIGCFGSKREEIINLIIEPLVKCSWTTSLVPLLTGLLIPRRLSHANWERVDQQNNRFINWGERKRWQQ